MLITLTKNSICWRDSITHRRHHEFPPQFFHSQKNALIKSRLALVLRKLTPLLNLLLERHLTIWFGELLPDLVVYIILIEQKEPLLAFRLPAIALFSPLEQRYETAVPDVYRFLIIKPCNR